MCGCGETVWNVIEENMTVEHWEGDLYVQDIFTWVVCSECGDDFACKAA